MIIRGIADAFTKLVAIFLWIAVIAFVIVFLMGLASAAENTLTVAAFSLNFLSIEGIQLVGLTLFIISMGMMAIFIDIRLTLIEIRDNGQGLAKRQDVDTRNQSINRRIEPTITPVLMVSDRLGWQNTDQIDEIAKDNSSNTLREFLKANDALLEKKAISKKIVHGGRYWEVNLTHASGSKSLTQTQLKELMDWVDSI